jgi:hypothetical protein
VRCCEVMRDWGAFYRCRGGGRRPDDAMVVVAKWRHQFGRFGLE